ncbi:tRNA (N(6)-L-threonylcarbamoyladenosine(37)-C(2))-methylthiotransferase MtaB [Saccharicrinis sp. FJH2]|uniref:tRNA (N(6)-L-threonylcarbamoyladenosine(37)-C(2))- methylthiotransferase MtaB n=1 Tax=Saccharicrinis sp. FJH65 TaxID=3344659 RepID=UPI0035F36EB0
MQKKVAFKTLGCRLNQYETEALATSFNEKGYEVVDFNHAADAYVINTCTVTGQSDQKSGYYINRAGKRNNKPVLVVTGCMVNNHEERLKERDVISYLVKNEHKTSIPNLLDAHFRGEIFPEQFLKQDSFSYGSAKQMFHTRSMIKIQDGCDNMCTFCIIPTVRGRAVSRAPEQVISNIRHNLENGFKEIVLTGVNIGRYFYEGKTFENLIEKILDMPEDFRLRISSLEPDGFTDRFANLFQHEKLMPHLHLCLQSGSDKVLLRMRRMYNVQTYMNVIETFKTRYPDFNFTTDIIVGFPGETNEDFKQTVKIAHQAEFSHIHTFKYSRRTGTRADRMTDHINENLKEERSKIIRDLSDENKLNYLKRFIGKTEKLLTETHSNEGFHGYGEHYIPIISTRATQKNQIIDTKLNTLTFINGEPFLTEY